MEAIWKNSPEFSAKYKEESVSTEVTENINNNSNKNQRNTTMMTAVALYLSFFFMILEKLIRGRNYRRFKYIIEEIHNC